MHAGFSIGRAAQMLGVSPNHIRILLYQGQLVGGKEGHDYVISAESVQAALEAGA